MLKFEFTAVAAAAIVMLGLSGGSAAAQTTSGQTGCAAAAARAADNIGLRLQQTAVGAENRQSANAHVAMASNAAAAGNEAECWHQLQVSSLFVALPAGIQAPAQQPTAAASAGGVQSGGGH